MRTREEFEQFRKEQAVNMSKDEVLQKDALSVFARADKHHHIHQTTFMGEPSLQTAEDLLVMGEIIFKTKPNLIVECGACWGGTTLFLSAMLKCSNPYGVVFAIDKYMPDDVCNTLWDRQSRNNLTEIELLNKDTVRDYEKIIEYIDATLDYDTMNRKRALVVLDSHHSESHVSSELSLYSELINKNDYIVVCDTIIEEFPEGQRDRDWGPGNNPQTALDKFLAQRDDFEIDTEIQNKLLMSCNSYIRKVK